jgi:hypothetical protein
MASIVRIENGKITDWADYDDGLTSRRTALAAHDNKKEELFEWAKFTGLRSAGRRA